MYKNPLKELAYKTYRRQVRRCSVPSNPSFKWYGARGIRVRYSFDEFWNWFETNYQTFNGNRPTVGRVDHSKDYTLDNIEMQSKADNTKERNDRCGNPHGGKKRPVVCFNALTMQPVQEYASTLEAEKATGVHNSNIRMYCLGKLHQTRTGLTFRFKEVR